MGADNDEGYARYTESVAKSRMAKRLYAEGRLQELEENGAWAMSPQALGTAYLAAGFVLMTVGELARAEVPLRKAVTLLSPFSHESPDPFAAAAGNLAKIYLSQWRIQEAEFLLKDLRVSIGTAGKENDVQGLSLELLEAELMMIKGNRERFDAIVGKFQDAIAHSDSRNAAAYRILGNCLVTLLLSAGEIRRGYEFAHALANKFPADGARSVDAIWAEKLAEAKLLGLLNEVEARDKVLHDAVKIGGLSKAMRANVLLFVGADQLAMGNQTEALAKYREVADIAKDLNTPTNIAATAYVRTAQILLNLGNLKASDEYADLALDALRKHPGVNPIAIQQTLTEIAELFLIQGHWPRAKALVREAKAFDTTAGSTGGSLMVSLVEFGIADAQKELAGLVVAESRITGALSERVVRQRFRRIGHGLDRFTSDTPFSRALEAYFTLSNASLGSREYVERSFMFAQTMNIGDVDDALMHAVARSKTINEEERAWLWQKQVLQLAIERSAVSADGQENAVAGLEQELNRIGQKLVTAGSVDMRPIDEPWGTVTGVQHALKEGQAMVMYRPGRESYYAWVVTPNDARFVHLNVAPKAISADVASLRRSLTPSQSGQLGAFAFDTSYALFRHLLAPLDSMLAGTSHIFIVPDNTLLALPFAALVMRPEKTGSERWAMSRYSFSTLPSPASLLYLRDLGVSRANEPFVGFGAPVLPLRVASASGRASRGGNVEQRIAQGSSGAFAPLPEAENELREMSRNYGAPDESVFVGAKATKSALNELPLDQFRIVAFATHGLLGGELKGVSEPGLMLTPSRSSGKSDNGILTATDIISLRFDADWVILSACNTAGGDERIGSGLAGLTRSFMFAGARAVLVSNWAVDSHSAVRLTTGISKQLSTHQAKDKAAALQQAMLSFVEESKDQRFVHPFFWAPFSIIGAIN